MSNKLILAGAGTGKTTYIVDEALKTKNRVLITTYTIRCKNEIIDKIIKKIGYVPNNINVQTWFSFLIEHGLLPYKNLLSIDNVNGINFVNGKSGKIYGNRYYSEKNFKKYYFDSFDRVYTDKLSKLVLKINNVSDNKVFSRIGKIYDTIYVDEAQDLSGYDLDIIKAIGKYNKNLLVVGDPRQTVYTTHCDQKYTKYNNGKIDDFIKYECKNMNFEIDRTSLNTCRRCHKSIVDFMNEFYPEYGALNKTEINEIDHQGVFVVRTIDLKKYLAKYNPIQLRYNKKTKIMPEYKFENYRNSKGTTYLRTLIYPTKKFEDYLKYKKTINEIPTKNALYVAISRAVNSVAIVYDGEINKELNIKVWKI